MSNITKQENLDFCRQLSIAKNGFYRFINSCKHFDNSFSLTPHADVSSYALCFAIFGYRLLQADDIIDINRDIWDRKLRKGLNMLQAMREREARLFQDKPYLQLLTFTLSALSILGTLCRYPLADQVLSLLPSDIKASLNDAKVFEGVARSGNQAMFMGILLIYARDYLGIDTQRAIDCWVNLHLSAMNPFGFWGPSDSMSHLQFQNGYHQYELLEYLHGDDVPWCVAADAIASLADAEGHFAPYPGGGGCYDYDAVFIITGTKNAAVRHRELLMMTAHSILSEQNKDGGFCESLRVRPRSLANISGSFLHAFNGSGRVRTERLRSFLTLLRPKHDRIHTHWSNYSREWGESDLWDSWFRMLTLARIDCAFNPEHSKSWGFINFPGIGFHPSVRGDY
jgi:hypothetical protein